MGSGIKLGFGFYPHMLEPEAYRFARQCGATHAVVHLVDYTAEARGAARDDQPVDGDRGWGRAGGSAGRWSVAALRALRDELAAEGLELAAIENFDPVDWSDVLLDGPRRDEQLGRLARIVRDVGAAGIPVIGYNFSIAGVAGRVRGPFARGGAISVGMEGVDERPIPRGMVWNMVVDPEAPPGVLPEIDHDELWRRAARFLEALVPVAEDAGVRLAAHPDDPPVPRLRRQPRLVHRPELYRRLLDLVPSRANALEFCLGSMAEMPEGEIDVYEALERHASRGEIAYVHFRNVRGVAPRYREVFLDEGDLDMPRALRILHECGYDGVVVPDHAPQLACAAPWHAGMAWAMGYLRALLQGLEG